MVPRPAPSQFWFLRIYGYSWCFIAPRANVVTAESDDPTHFTNVIHLTRDNLTPDAKQPDIKPLCGRFSMQEYRGRRLTTPAMAEANVCRPCVRALQSIEAAAITHAGSVALLHGTIEQRGDLPQRQAQEAIAALSQSLMDLTLLHQQNAEALRAAIARMHALGLPFDLPPVLALPTSSASSHSAGDIEERLVWFESDDDFLDWCDLHTDDGFILNGVGRSFKLHRASCTTFQRILDDGSYTQGTHGKLGTVHPNDALRLLKHVFSATVTDCEQCHPHL